MVNTINILNERNKELLNKIEELENKEKTEISREAQLKIIEGIQQWKKENYETGNRLKKYEGNTYPSFIANSDWPVWKSLAGHVNFELNLVQYLDKEENPLNELLEMMLDAITRNVIRYRNLQGLKDEAVEEKWRLKEEVKEIMKEKETYFKTSTDYKIRIEQLEKELEGKEIIIEKQKEQIAVAKLDAEVHLEALTEVSKRWNDAQKEELRKDAKDKLELLQKANLNLERTQTIIGQQSKEIEEKDDQLEKSAYKFEMQEAKIEALKRELYLSQKPLPPLPKKGSKFQQLGTKIKSKLHKFQNLAKRVKRESQEFIARIEVKTK